MRKFPVLTLICGALLLNPILIACEEQGPAEQLGENVDNAVENAGDKVEDATDK